jgi:aspartyl-tRNA(Asn)/glutamyl-tRNA(Gln) amidotransferase subunit B
MSIIQGQTGEWEMVIGLEVHAQITSHSKLFSGAATEFGAEPNAQVSLVDAGFPGMLPVINGKCVEQAVRTGLGLRAQVNLTSIFDRKNYFYADLPAGYQISQFKHPIIGRGEILLDLADGASRTVGITRLHLEQDAGKSMHDQSPTETYVDLNRSGVALMEIVSEPDMRSGEEAGAYLKKLRAIMRYLGSCDGNMEEGSMRCDVNLSMRRVGDTRLGTRCEIKNVNSIRFVQQAIEYESRRQVALLESGEAVKQETRLWDAAKGETRSMRSKEEAHDYRYFPDPDLLPLMFDSAFVDAIKRTLPELPDDKKARFIGDYGLSPYNATVLVAEQDVAAFFESVIAAIKKTTPGVPVTKIALEAANVVTGDYFAALKRSEKAIANFQMTSEMLAGLVKLKLDDVISGRIAKDVFEAMLETGMAAAQIVQDRGLEQVTDTGAIEKAIDDILAVHTDKVAAYRSGKDKLFGFFVGQVMKATGGKANPDILNTLLKKKLTPSV